MAAEGMRKLQEVEVDDWHELYQVLKKIMIKEFGGKRNCTKHFECDGPEEDQSLRRLQAALTKLGYNADMRKTQKTKETEIQRCNVYYTLYTRVMDISW
jgi:N-acetyl-anhydromuramyl-L-alanine amidase AmpD